jgi:hypothetical protein
MKTKKVETKKSLGEVVVRDRANGAIMILRLAPKKMGKKVKKTMKFGKELHNPWHKKSVFFWCLHCERTYRRGECREIDGLQMCPYEGCDGDTVCDAWSWESVRSENTQYPVIPSEGEIYPLYPEKQKTKK